MVNGDNKSKQIYKTIYIQNISYFDWGLPKANKETELRKLISS